MKTLLIVSLFAALLPACSSHKITKSADPKYAAAVQNQSKTGRIYLYEDANVQIWITKIIPHDLLALHRHDNDRIVVPLEDTILHKVFEKNIRPSEIMKWKKGKAYAYGPDPLNELHGDLNKQKDPAHVVVIQFKKPVK